MQDRQRYKKPLLLYPEKKSTATKQDTRGKEFYVADEINKAICVVNYNELSLLAR